MSFDFSVQSGNSLRLKTEGKYCDRDIVVTAYGGEGGTELPELNNPGSSSHLLEGKELYDDNGNLIKGTMPAATQAIPTISVDANGKITASATQTAGYVSGGTKSATEQLETVPGITITPGTSEKTAVPAGCYTTGDVKIAAVPSVARANTTITTAADDTNDKLTVTASNNQSTGYVTGGNKTATKTITLTASGATVTASDGEKSISKTVTDANLIPENIKEGVSIFNVLGTFIGSGGGSDGGIPDGLSALTGGTITPASDTSDGGLNYLEHDLGTAPNFFIITMNSPVSPADHAGYVVALACFKCKIGNTETLGIYFRPSANGSISQTTMNYPGMGSIMFADTQIAYFGSLKAGVEYAWMCGVIEGLA